MRIQIDDIVGDYRVIDAVGAGATGAVYKVEHRITRRVEAMKALPTGIGVSEEEVRRFEREIQVQARMHHPNIAAVYTAVRQENWLALVMEYVDGESLRARLDRERLSTAEALAIASDVLAALDCAHRSGVVHGDVSPANIMLTGAGSAKLTDFGLALDALRDRDTGIPAGTPAYMSPEQVRGVDIDPRSDLYAAGAVLYEMLTGRKLFDGDSPFAVLRAHVEQPPAPLRRFARNIPEALDAAVLKSLAKDPASRFQTAAEFRDALAKAVAPRRANRSVLAAFAAVAVVASCGAAIIRSKTVPLPGPIPTPAPPPAPVVIVPAEQPRVAVTPEAEDPKPRTIHHQLAADRAPAGGLPAVSPSPAAKSDRHPPAADADLTPLPEISLPSGVAAPPVAMPAAEAPKPEPKQGNRFVRALGKINPFRRAPKADEKPR